MNLGFIFTLSQLNQQVSLEPDQRLPIQLSAGLGTYKKQQADQLLTRAFENFIATLHDQNIMLGEIVILKKNLTRSRIVFSTKLNNGELIVCKWVDENQVGCFNFVESINTEINVHSTPFEKHNGFIPKLVTKGRDFFAVEHIDGTPLISFFCQTKVDELKYYSTNICENLALWYQNNYIGELSAKEFNKNMHADHIYFNQFTRTKISDRASIGLSAPKDVMSRYKQMSIEAFNIFSMRPEPWKQHLLLRDLDEHNILVNEKKATTHIVDTEDSHGGNIAFDLAWLSSRLFLADDPDKVAKFFIPKAHNLIKAIDNTGSSDTIKLYNVLVARNLIAIAINPRFWPPKPRQMSRLRWLNRVWSLSNKLYEGC